MKQTQLEERSRRHFPTGLAIGLILILCEGCRTDSPEIIPNGTGAADAMARVLEADTRLAEVRNHAGETAPLHAGIEAYVRGLEELDFRGCPGEFVDAFTEHREAWLASVPFFERHADLRGELHDVFETIRGYGGEERTLLEKHEAAIWSTWHKVEAANAPGSSSP